MGLLLTVPLAVAALATSGVLVVPRGTGSPQTVDAAAVRHLAATDGRSNAECRLAVPAAPLTARGLATPYRLASKNGQRGDCHETDLKQAAFVEAVVYDPAAHSLAVYHPLVVDTGTMPAAQPVPVQLPANSVVGLWIGFNGKALNLTGPGAGRCIDSVGRSSFGHFAYCNAAAFFAAVNNDHQVVVPPAGSGVDGLPCPTSRDFSVVDQHQADYVTTAYREVDGRIAQDTSGTRSGTRLTNVGGHVLGDALDPAVGCHPFTAPDLTDGGTPTTALALDELSAAANQGKPAALVPGSDPLVIGPHGRTSVRKTDVYRAGVDQSPFPSGQSRPHYCQRLNTLAPNRLDADAALLRAADSPVSSDLDLFSYMALRLQATLKGLRCSTSAAVRHLVAQAGGGTGGTTSASGSSTPTASPAATSSDPTPTTTSSSDPTSSDPTSTTTSASTSSSSSSSASSSSATATSTPPSTTNPPPPPHGPTLWGSSVMPYNGESFQQAYARVQQQLHPQIVRWYNPGGPSWPTKTGDMPLSISFKIPPAQVLDGSHDAQLKAFFDATPRTTYWTYWHEPEDDIANGRFSAADYRAAWRHIAALAKASGKPLVSTLILMGWTTMPQSHRTWTDYYPGSDAIDVLGWDPYLLGPTSTPASIFDPVIKASTGAGKPWAIAETAVSHSKYPDASKRAAMLTEMSNYLANASPAPVFVTYFDSDTSGKPDCNISLIPEMAAAWMKGE